MVAYEECVRKGDGEIEGDFGMVFCPQMTRIDADERGMHSHGGPWERAGRINRRGRRERKGKKLTTNY
jgi:hypothetical protein